MMGNARWARVVLCALLILANATAAVSTPPPVPVFNSSVLAGTAADETGPSASGRHVAYVYKAAAQDSDVLVRNLETGTNWNPIPPDSADQFDPDMGYNVVAYTDTGAGNAEIYRRSTNLWDLERLTNNAANQLYPSVSGMNTIWYDAGTSSLWYHDGYHDALLVNRPIPGSGGVQMRVHDLDAGTVVFARDDGVSWRLYRYTIGSTRDAESFYTLATDVEVTSLAVHDQRVVWSEDHGTGNHVHTKSVFGDAPDVMIDSLAGAAGGSVSAFHDTAAWNRESAGQLNIRFALQNGTLSTNATEELTSEIEPSIFGRRIAYRLPGDVYLAKAAPDFDRLAGDSRYKTAVAISQEHFPSATTAVLCTGENFPDALTAAPFARFVHAPLLLSRSTVVPTEVITELQRLGVHNVFLIGGTAALAGSVQTQLETAGFTTERIFGQSRYETAQQIAYRLVDGLAYGEIPFGDSIFIARGDAFPDALAAAPVASAWCAPILLTPPNELCTPLIQFMQNMTIKNAYVIGGTGAISENNFEEIEAYVLGYGGAASRWDGGTRYETAVDVVNNGIASDVIDLDTLGFATAANFPDALAGGVGVSTGHGALLLVPPSGPLPSNSAQPYLGVQQFLSAHAWEIGRAEIYGGTSAVDAGVAGQLAAYLH